MKSLAEKMERTVNPFMKFFKTPSAARSLHVKAVFGILMSAVLLTGCGSGGGGPENNGASSSLLSGIFVDSPVQGLEYETESRLGVTEADGTFMYMEGETITFYVGDIMLGGAVARPVMTPVDLVEGAFDETDPAVTNMARFLQTLDADMDPENGITITGEMADAMTGHSLDFDMDMDAFEHSEEMQSVMDEINMMDASGTMHSMVPIEDAQDHLYDTMNGFMNSGDVTTGDSTMPGGGMMG